MIKEIRIYGYKKFEDYTVTFKEELNIIIGDNESGKSSILEALNIALNCKLPFNELSALKYFFNVNSIENYYKCCNFDNLPRIVIEIDFEIDKSVNIQYENFFGARYMENIKTGNYKNQKYGIMFECIPDEEFRNEIDEIIRSKEIPYEYYMFSWKTYKDEVLKLRSKKPMKSYMLDNTKNLDSYSINRYSADLFKVLKDDKEQKNIKSKFYGVSDKLYTSNELDISTSRKFNLLVENTNFAKYLSILDEDVLLELKGKGKERRIITELALQNNSNVELVIIEEPEMNLSNVSLNKLIATIESEFLKNDDTNIRQMIISTHSNLVANKLELDNILYLGKSETSLLSNLNKETVLYFKKLDNNNIVDMLNSRGNIIVEGASEYILIPALFEKYTKDKYKKCKSLSDYGIKLSSGQGLTFKHYEDVLSERENKSIFITDNDKQLEKVFTIDKNKQFNKISSSDIDEWTFEVALYNKNKDILKKILKVESKKNVTQEYKGVEMDSKTLAYMLNNKTVASFKLLLHVDKLVIPEYIGKAFEWIES